VKKGCGYTIPWLDLDVDQLHNFVAGEEEFLPEPLANLYPKSIFADVEGKDVLCLASGGGQQSAVFSLLGGLVTVVELAEGQLAGDRKAAKHYGYEVTTIHADMRDLSSLADDSFDLVYQAPSMAYIPDIKDVYSGVARVQRPGGLYRLVISQPATHLVDWDGKAYYIAGPYREKVFHREDGGIEFRHYMDDIFNGLLDSGLSIKRVCEGPYSRKDPQAHPGSWNHERAYVGGQFTIIAGKLK